MKVLEMESYEPKSCGLAGASRHVGQGLRSRQQQSCLQSNPRGNMVQQSRHSEIKEQPAASQHLFKTPAYRAQCPISQLQDLPPQYPGKVRREASSGPVGSYHARHTTFSQHPQPRHQHSAPGRVSAECDLAFLPLFDSSHISTAGLPDQRQAVLQNESYVLPPLQQSGRQIIDPTKVSRPRSFIRVPRGKTLVAASCPAPIQTLPRAGGEAQPKFGPSSASTMSTSQISEDARGERPPSIQGRSLACASAELAAQEPTAQVQKFKDLSFESNQAGGLDLGQLDLAIDAAACNWPSALQVNL